MIIDAQDIVPGQTLEADVAIVGAGAAGITLASRLGVAGFEVLLLEGGDRDWKSQTL